MRRRDPAHRGQLCGPGRRRHQLKWSPMGMVSLRFHRKLAGAQARRPGRTGDSALQGVSLGGTERPSDGARELHGASRPVTADDHRELSFQGEGRLSVRGVL